MKHYMLEADRIKPGKQTTGQFVELNDPVAHQLMEKTVALVTEAAALGYRLADFKLTDHGSISVTLISHLGLVRK